MACYPKPSKYWERFQNCDHLFSYSHLRSKERDIVYIKHHQDSNRFFLISDESDGKRDGGCQASITGPRLLRTLAHTAFEMQKGNVFYAMEMPSRETLMGKV